MELEKAYRALELKPGATFKEVSEAREDLLALWDPDRLTDYPRLRTRGEGKIREIQEAYGVLMEYLGQTGIRKVAPRDPKPLEAHGRHGTAHEDAAPSSTSLFDEVFSSRPVRRNRPGLVLIVILGIVLLTAVVAFWLLAGRASAPEQETFSAPRNESPAMTVGEDHLSNPNARSRIPETPPNTPEETAGSDQNLPRSPDAQPELPRAPRPAAPPDSQPAAVPSSASTPSAPRTNGSRPVLVRGNLESADPEASRQREAVKEVERAVRILLAKSPAARNLTRGKTSSLHFSEWLLVDRKQDELWIGRIAAESGGRPIQFVWAVDPESQKVRPVSEPARSLEQSSN